MTPEKRRLRMMPGAWCNHDYPVEVRVYDRGRRARCLMCHEVGPVRGDAHTARAALIEERSKRQKPPSLGNRTA